MKNYIWESTNILWFSVKLEEYLRFNNIKQHVFAKMLGVSQPHINLVLQGKRRPSVSLAKKIESVTKGRVSAFELLGINKPEKIISINETVVSLTKQTLNVFEKSKEADQCFARPYQPSRSCNPSSRTTFLSF